MRKSSLMELIGVLFFSFSIAVSAAHSADLKIEGYNYSVTDVKAKGLTGQQLFNSLSTSWMDLEHSVCSNRAHVWAYDLKRKYGVNAGTIFIFFGAKVWEGQKKKYWYHAAPYIVEDGKEMVLEGSYPAEVFGPLSIVGWMENEMEGRVASAKCVELTPADTDMTEWFYGKGFLPNTRPNGKPAFDCYYRRVPAYVPYPEMAAELEFGKFENGKPIDYQVKGFEHDTLWNACVDAFTGTKYIRRGKARKFCDSYI